MDAPPVVSRTGTAQQGLGAPVGSGTCSVGTGLTTVFTGGSAQRQSERSLVRVVFVGLDLKVHFGFS